MVRSRRRQREPASLEWRLLDYERQGPANSATARAGRTRPTFDDRRVRLRRHGTSDDQSCQPGAAADRGDEVAPGDLEQISSRGPPGRHHDSNWWNSSRPTLSIRGLSTYAPAASASAEAPLLLMSNVRSSVSARAGVRGGAPSRPVGAPPRYRRPGSRSPRSPVPRCGRRAGRTACCRGCLRRRAADHRR